MIAIERQIQKVRPGKWAALEEIDKKFDVAEAGLGFPSKRRYRCYFGGHDTNTLIIERQWASMAVMEATYEKAFVDPAYQQLLADIESINESTQIEIYSPLP
jgi:hypothetical protein